ncbi:MULTISPECIES: AraC family transcriptional regulator [unclassified Crossiella]|uniref:AraC family transcriptional regulator n=1 Tax=unclassified Crossiella TaxID=2620835 RepID=UPI001FFE2D51|nr:MULTISPECIES: AraC family transcriptional regulator [unclassified Crossiella]MCK2240167.1 AraC family transcriptional regulator [Crossiella sp. S99.2]MCK2253381.1 AraC family transcriptional regulator [Crossiella sp. S99.1]
MILFEGRDVDEVHEVVSNHFAPHRLRVVANQPLAGRFTAVHVGAVSVFELGYGADVEVRPGEMPDIYNVHVPLSGHGELRVDNLAVGTESSVVGPGQRLRMRWSGDSNTLILRFARAAIDEALATRLGDLPATPTRFDPEIRAAAQSWLVAMRAFADNAAAGLFARSPLAAAHFEQMLVHGLLDTQPHTLSEALAEPGRPELPQVLRRAMAYCEEHAAEPITPAHMAVAARVGVRSLQRAFRSHLDTTPLAYLYRIRLDRAHQDLLAIAEGRAGGSVTEVALRWGFTHLGRFSAQYRQVYGHPPVRTLRPADRLRDNVREFPRSATAG